MTGAVENLSKESPANSLEWMSSPRQIRKEAEKKQSRSGVGEEPKEFNIEKAKATFVSMGRLWFTILIAPRRINEN